MPYSVGVLWADLHVHSNFSDGKLSIPEIIDFYGQRGFGVIAITDHLCEELSILGKAAAYLNKTLTPSSFPSYIETIRCESERAWQQYKMLVIPGVEVTKNSLRFHRTAHILSLGTEEYISADLEIDDILTQIKDLGGFSVAAHPIPAGKVDYEHYHLWDRRNDLAERFDAWEMTDSGRILEPVVRTSYRKIATSDFHRPQHIRSWKTLLDCKPEQGAVFEAIRKSKISYRYYGGT